MHPLAWASILALLAMAFIVLEVFVPSGGGLGFLAGLSIFGSVAMVYTGLGLDAAAYYLVALAVCVPLLVATALKWWPHTPIGRRVLNLPPGEEAEIAGAMDYSRVQALVGRRGLARTILVPSGVVVVDGITYDAVADGEAIEIGEPIEIVATEGTMIVVRRAEPAAEDPDPRTTADTRPENLVDDPFQEE